MADEREAAEQRHLRGGHILGGDDDSSDDDCAAIGYQNLRLFGLCVQGRDTLNARNALVNLRILDQHVMKTVPSPVICGVTSSLSTASMNWTEIVLLIVVWMGIFCPCLMIAFSLFWVTTRGLESSFPTPFDSAAVMKKSTAKLGER